MLFGSILGGIIAALLAAPILTSYFGLMSCRPEMTPLLLLPGSVVGTSVVVFFIVNFDLERLNGRRFRANALASFLALACSIPFGIFVFGPLYFLGTVDLVRQFLEKHFDNVVGLMEGGVCYGIPVGMVLGFAIGVAILITQAWSGKPVLR